MTSTRDGSEQHVIPSCTLHITFAGRPQGPFVRSQTLIEVRPAEVRSAEVRGGEVDQLSQQALRGPRNGRPRCDSGIPVPPHPENLKCFLQFANACLQEYSGW